jgi:hypothetical protein
LPRREFAACVSASVSATKGTGGKPYQGEEVDIINREDMQYEREQALDAIKVMVDELNDCLRAAETIQKQFIAGDDKFDFKELREAIDVLGDQTDGYWGMLTLGKRGGLGQIENYVDNVETPYEDEEEQGETVAA